jgi:hypothetical protein
VSVLSGGNCTACSPLSSALCSSTCPDFYFANSSNICTACWSTYGSYCISCTNSVCTECAYSSGTVVSEDGLKCIASSCSDPECVQCYNNNGTNYCQICKTGYNVNSNYSCTVSSCTIPFCTTCQNQTSCSGCAVYYYLSADQSSCLPVCSDINCKECLKPSFCGLCVDGYNAVNGVCQIDCALTIVANCELCTFITNCK